MNNRLSVTVGLAIALGIGTACVAPAPMIEEDIEVLNAQATIDALQAQVEEAQDVAEEPAEEELVLPELAFSGVSSNAEWEPFIQAIGGVHMALVPQGCFQMGSTDGDTDEYPIHEVCFEAPFWIDVYEVTNGQFGGASPTWSKFSSGDDQPRIAIDWLSAAAHCAARGARLPTEAEWEFAARGPDGLVYPWGNEFNADNVTYTGNTEEATEVGSRSSGVSWVGVYDLSGNAWEWVNDWYGTYSAEDQSDPTGPAEGEHHVMRGGAFDSRAVSMLRSAERFLDKPDAMGVGYGFRCALSYSP